MTRFPELPPLPDIVMPIKKFAEGIKIAAETLDEADEAGEQFSDAMADTKENFERIIRRKPFA